MISKPAVEPVQAFKPTVQLLVLVIYFEAIQKSILESILVADHPD